MTMVDSFLVRLGFEIDKDEEAKFKGSTDGAAKRIKSLGKTAAGFATAMGAAVLKASSEMSKLNYMSERTGASVEGMRALGRAFVQTGGNVEMANQALVAFHEMQATYGSSFDALVAQNLGVQVRKSTGELKDQADVLMEIAGKLRRMNLQDAIAQGSVIGLSPEVVELMRNKNFAKNFEDAKKHMKDMGVDLEANAKKARKFMNDINSMWDDFKTWSMNKLVTLVGDQLHEIAEAFPKFLADLEKKIEKFFKKIDSDGIVSTMYGIITGSDEEREKKGKTMTPIPEEIRDAAPEGSALKTSASFEEAGEVARKYAENASQSSSYDAPSGEEKAGGGAEKQTVVPQRSTVTTPTGEKTPAQNVSNSSTSVSTSTKNATNNFTQTINVYGSKDLARSTGRAAKDAYNEALRINASYMD